MRDIAQARHSAHAAPYEDVTAEFGIETPAAGCAVRLLRNAENTTLVLVSTYAEAQQHSRLTYRTVIRVQNGSPATHVRIATAVARQLRPPGYENGWLRRTDRTKDTAARCWITDYVLALPPPNA